MSRLQVWAPSAERVEAVVDSRRLRLRADEGGWWALDEALPAGTDYGCGSCPTRRRS